MYIRVITGVYSALAVGLACNAFNYYPVMHVIILPCHACNFYHVMHEITGVYSALAVGL